MSTEREQAPLPYKRKRAVFASAFVVACIIAVFVVFWWRSNDLPPHSSLPSPTASSVQVLLPAEATGSGEISSAPANSRLLASSNDSRSPGTLDAFAVMLKEKAIEVCGVSAAEEALPLARGEWQGTASAAFSEATGSLSRSDNPRDHALGLYLQLHQVEWQAKEVEGSAYRPCLEGGNCRRNESTELSQRMRAASTEPLVRLALTGNDPAIYAAAVYACDHRRSAPCASISVTDWAKREPDNAAIWLMFAEEAASRKDIIARDAALQRAVSAPEFNLHRPPFSLVLETNAFRRQSPLSQYSIAGALVGLNTQLWMHSSTITLARLCGGSEPLDEARKGVCSFFAGKLVEADESAFALANVESIGRRVGWDEVRLQALRDDSAVTRGLSLDLSFGEKTYACDGLIKSNRWVQSALSKGERAAAREHVAKTGKTLSEVAEMYRKAYPGLRR